MLVPRATVEASKASVASTSSGSAPPDLRTSKALQVAEMCGVKVSLENASDGQRLISLEGQLPQVSAALSLLGSLEQSSGEHSKSENGVV